MIFITTSKNAPKSLRQFGCKFAKIINAIYISRSKRALDRLCALVQKSDCTQIIVLSKRPKIDGICALKYIKDELGWNWCKEALTLNCDLIQVQKCNSIYSSPFLVVAKSTHAKKIVQYLQICDSYKNNIYTSDCMQKIIVQATKSAFSIQTDNNAQTSDDIAKFDYGWFVCIKD